MPLWTYFLLFRPNFLFLKMDSEVDSVVHCPDVTFKMKALIFLYKLLGMLTANGSKLSLSLGIDFRQREAPQSRLCLLSWSYLLPDGLMRGSKAWALALIQDISEGPSQL